VKRLKLRNPVYMVKKMARPEHMFGIGNYIQHLRQGVRAALLGDVYNLVYPHLSDGDKESFTMFYREMVVSFDAQAREDGAPIRTVRNLREHLDGLESFKDLPDDINGIITSVFRLMENPEPLEI
jgi:hypothetical protein